MNVGGIRRSEGGGAFKASWGGGGRNKGGGNWSDNPCPQQNKPDCGALGDVEAFITFARASPGFFSFPFVSSPVGISSLSAPATSRAA